MNNVIICLVSVLKDHKDGLNEEDIKTYRKCFQK